MNMHNTQAYIMQPQTFTLDVIYRLTALKNKKYMPCKAMSIGIKMYKCKYDPGPYCMFVDVFIVFLYNYKLIKCVNLQMNL